MFTGAVGETAFHAMDALSRKCGRVEAASIGWMERSRLILKDGVRVGGARDGPGAIHNPVPLSRVALLFTSNFAGQRAKDVCMQTLRDEPPFSFSKGPGFYSHCTGERGTSEGEKVSKNSFLRRKPASSSSASVSPHPELLSVIESRRKSRNTWPIAPLVTSRRFSRSGNGESKRDRKSGLERAYF